MASQRDSNAIFNAPAPYNDYMGRFSAPLASQFVNTIPITRGEKVLDLGCGPGALTTELVPIVGAESVSVIDPSPQFLESCVASHPGVTGKVGRAEQLPFEDDSFDAVMSQLVVHFFQDLGMAGREIVRVTRPGGYVAVCTWIMGKMELFTLLDRAVLAAMGKTEAPARPRKFDVEGNLGRYLESIGLVNVSETTIAVEAEYIGFDELWSTYLSNVGRSGPWLLAQSDVLKSRVRAEAYSMLGEPGGKFTLRGVARSAVGRVPG